jgi:hypothetical protein
MRSAHFDDIRVRMRSAHFDEHVSMHPPVSLCILCIYCIYVCPFTGSQRYKLLHARCRCFFLCQYMFYMHVTHECTCMSEVDP